MQPSPINQFGETGSTHCSTEVAPGRRGPYSTCVHFLNLQCSNDWKKQKDNQRLTVEESETEGRFVQDYTYSTYSVQ